MFGRCVLTSTGTILVCGRGGRKWALLSAPRAKLDMLDADGHGRVKTAVDPLRSPECTACGLLPAPLLLHSVCAQYHVCVNLHFVGLCDADVRHVQQWHHRADRGYPMVPRHRQHVLEGRARSTDDGTCDGRMPRVCCC